MEPRSSSCGRQAPRPRTSRRVRVLFVVVAIGLAGRGARAKTKTAKDWSKLDEAALAKEWEEGDDEEELSSEHDAYEAAVEKRKAMSGGGGGVDLSQLQNMDPDEVKKKFAHQQSNTGMAMIFATLAKTQPDGTEWTEAAETAIAGEYTALLQSGGLKVSVYRVDPRRLLVTMQTGWYGEDVIKFLTEQPAVMKATWDSMDYENPNVEQEQDGDLPSSENNKPNKPKATKKKTSTKKKKKSKKSNTPAAGDNNKPDL